MLLPTCNCGHRWRDHPAHYEHRCVVPSCACRLWRIALPDPAQPATAPSLRELLAAGRTSHKPRAVRLAARIAADMVELVKLLRAEPTGRRSSANAGRTFPRDKACPECGRIGFANVGVHRYRVHGYRKESA